MAHRKVITTLWCVFFHSFSRKNAILFLVKQLSYYSFHIKIYTFYFISAQYLSLLLKL